MLAWILALALQAPSSAQAPASPGNTAPSGIDAPSPKTTEPAAPDIKPWPGPFAEGFDAVRSHADKRAFDEALGVCDQLLAPTSFLRWRAEQASQGGWRAWLSNAADPLIDLAGCNALTPASRAEIHFAKGVVSERARNFKLADESFGRARELAGPGELRLDSTYELGSLALALGEEQRAKIPEISGAPAQPPAAAAAPAAPGAPPPPDPLQLARAAYMQAREHFVERLKSDWRDADTQADVELVMKRLKQLDEIEKKRQEQQKDQDKKDQKDKDKQKDQKKDDKDKSDKSDKDKSDDKQDPSPEKPDDKKDPKKDEKPPEPDKKDDAQKKAEEKEKQDKKDEQAADPKEQKMSKEEMMQILDRLQQIEEQAKKLQEQLRAMRRVKVKKDW